MLVLARNPGQSIDLIVKGVQIRITFAEMRGFRAVIGVDAPRSVKVLRSELAIEPQQKVSPNSFEPIPEETREAALSSH